MVDQCQAGSKPSIACCTTAFPRADSPPCCGGYVCRSPPNDSPDYHLLGASIIGDDTKESISLTIK